MNDIKINEIVYAMRDKELYGGQVVNIKEYKDDESEEILSVEYKIEFDSESDFVILQREQFLSHQEKEDDMDSAYSYIYNKIGVERWP